MNPIITIARETLFYVAGTLVHNAPVLLLGILVSAVLAVYVDAEKLRGMLMRRSIVSIPATVAFGTFTPFCACGTMAVVVAMFTTVLPWGPIMAFMTSSPLMGPDEFIFISGIVSVKFAVALTVASIFIGLGAGFLTQLIEKKSRFLDGQTRFSREASSTQEAGSQDSAEASTCGDCTVAAGCTDKYKIREFLLFCFNTGVKQILPYFAVFAAIGYLINQYVPADLITRYLGQGNVFAVPLLALIGLPLYVTGPSSLPVISALMNSGASSGALLAFMITGPGTSAGVIAGTAMIMKKKAILLYVGFLLAGAILLGYLYDLFLFIGR